MLIYVITLPKYRSIITAYGLIDDSCGERLGDNKASCSLSPT
jgi:hypothetical protein